VCIIVENKKCFDIVDARYKHEDYNTDVEQLIFFHDSDSACSDQVQAILCSSKGPATGEALFLTVKR
jgi:hypothetical protein